MEGVAQQVIEHPGQLVRVAVVCQTGRQLQFTPQVLFRELGGKLTGHLLQHPGQVRRLLLQLQMGQAEAGDVKELIDEVLQPLRLLQGDAGIPAPQLRGELRLVPQQRKVADDAGERRLQIMGQIDHQIVFPLLCLPGSPGVPQGPFPDGVQLPLQVLHGLRQLNGLLSRLGQLLCRRGQRVHQPHGAGNEGIADSHPAQQDDQHTHKDDVIPYPVEELVERIPRIPRKGAAYQIPQEDRRQHHRHPGRQCQQIESPGPQGPAAAPVRQRGPFSSLIQWYTPPPRPS